MPQEYVRLNEQIDEIKLATRDHKDYEKSIEELTVILKETKKHGFDYLSARTYSFIGYYFGQLNLNRKAYLAYKEAMHYWQLCDSTDDKSLYAVNHNLGGIAHDFRDFDQAIMHYEAALEYENSLTNDDISDTYYSLGLAYADMKTKEGYKIAEKYYMLSLEYAEKDEVHSNKARIYYAIGEIYKDLDEFEISDASYKEAIRYSKMHNLDEYLECSYEGVGELYFQHEMYDKSIEMLSAAVEYDIDREIAYYAWKNLGHAYLKFGEYHNALNAWESALEYKDEIVTPEVAEIYNDMALAYKMSGDTDKAFEYASTYNSKIAELLTTKNIINGSYETVLFKDVISQYEEFQRKENFQQRFYDTYLPFGLAMISILLGVIVYFSYQSRQRRKDTAEKIKSFQVD
jgi:tetratricopeptide (TPR) repeat protein